MPVDAMEGGMQTSRRSMPELTTIDLFAGAGGLSVGLRRAGFRVACAVELDPHAAHSFRLNHRDAEVLVDDIRRVTGPMLTRAARLRGRRLDLLTGCPPCQGFSTLRTRRHGVAVPDDRNNLILEYLRLVRSLRPRAIVLENVPGLALNAGYRTFCRGLSDAGYDFQSAVVDASDFGVPQRRKRLVLVAVRGGAAPTDWITHKVPRPRTVRDAIGGLAAAGSSGDVLHDLPEKRSPEVMRRIRATPRDGGSRTDLGPDQQCSCHATTDGFFDVYGRMAWSIVAPTITSGCNNPSKGRFLHPEEHRAITLREAALLQGFPRNYRFDLTRGKEHVAAQIGNAFPPPLILPIAKSIAKVLGR